MEKLLFILLNGQLNNNGQGSWQQSDCFSDCNSMGLFALESIPLKHIRRQT